MTGCVCVHVINPNTHTHTPKAKLLTIQTRRRRRSSYSRHPWRSAELHSDANDGAEPGFLHLLDVSATPVTQPAYENTHTHTQLYWRHKSASARCLKWPFSHAEPALQEHFVPDPLNLLCDSVRRLDGEAGRRCRVQNLVRLRPLARGPLTADNVTYGNSFGTNYIVVKQTN